MKEAEKAAAAEDLAGILRDAKTPFGYYGVRSNNSQTSPYKAYIGRGLDEKRSTWRCTSAATRRWRRLARARAAPRRRGSRSTSSGSPTPTPPPPLAAAAAAPPMTLQEAEKAAAEEDLELLRDAKTTFGFYGVASNSNNFRRTPTRSTLAPGVAEVLDVEAYGGATCRRRRCGARARATGSGRRPLPLLHRHRGPPPAPTARRPPPSPTTAAAASMSIDAPAPAPAPAATWRCCATRSPTSSSTPCQQPRPDQKKPHTALLPPPLADAAKKAGHRPLPGGRVVPGAVARRTRTRRSIALYKQRRRAPDYQGYDYAARGRRRR